MRKSRHILLTVMGALLASGCGRAPDTLRNVYNTRDDCVHDYSQSQCREERSYHSSGGGYSAGRWIGPDYRADNPIARADDPGPGRENRAAERQIVSRGGFGNTGRSFTRGS